MFIWKETATQRYSYGTVSALEFYRDHFKISVLILFFSSKLNMNAMPITLSLGRLRPEECCKSKASLNCNKTLSQKQMSE